MKIDDEISFDQRSKRFVLVPFCLICQAFQAQGIVRLGHTSVIRPIMDEILNNDLNIIQMPCPESRLGGGYSNLIRKPKSILKYDTPEFRKVCEESAGEVVEKVKAVIDAGYQVVAILGVEFSPSCSVKLQYSDKGVFHRSGIFIECLQKMLLNEVIDIPLVGINRRGMKKSIKTLKETINKYEKLF